MKSCEFYDGHKNRGRAALRSGGEGSRKVRLAARNFLPFDLALLQSSQLWIDVPSITKKGSALNPYFVEVKIMPGCSVVQQQTSFLGQRSGKLRLEQSTGRGECKGTHVTVLVRGFGMSP